MSTDKPPVLVHRGHARRLTRAIDAAADVRESLACLVYAWSPGSDIFDTLDAAIRGHAIAANIDERTRCGWAGDLFAFSTCVARNVLALPEPTTEDDARAAAAAAAGVVADALAKLGPAGRERADMVRQRAAERAAAVLAGELLAGELWRPWRHKRSGPNHVPGWLLAIARALWIDRWKPELVRMMNPASTIATPEPWTMSTELATLRQRVDELTKGRDAAIAERDAVIAERAAARDTLDGIVADIYKATRDGRLPVLTVPFIRNVGDLRHLMTRVVDAVDAERKSPLRWPKDASDRIAELERERDAARKRAQELANAAQLAMSALESVGGAE